MRFQGKKALVTGAAGGIGKSLVRKLRAEGASVAITDITLSNVEAEASASTLLRVISVIATDAPSALNFLTSDLPIPPAAPVTRAFFP